MHQTTLAAQTRQLVVMLGCLLGTTLTSVSAYADDTEVFFSSVRGGTLSKSNILFVLDNSGSMGYDYDDVWRWGEDYSTPDLGVSNRMSDLQATMNGILQTIQNVNIGMMTFTYDCLPSTDDCDTRDNYAQLIHPIVDIDAGTNRASLTTSVDGMLPRTNTPITASLYEAAMAMTQGLMGRPAGTTASYPEVMLSECQQNHIVLLTDGIANSDVPETEIMALPGMGAGSCGVGTPSGEHCGVELAAWLNDTDHRPGSVDKNPIVVHTIGFAFDQAGLDNGFLEDMAIAGGGGYREAQDGGDLTTVFNEILKEVKDVDTTFVAPVTTTDRLNRLGQSDDLYFGMFTPSLKPQWDGNLKKYKLGLDSNGNVIIQDGSVPAKNAISDTTGFFADNARSVWSNSTDGADVTKGGAASKISHTNRNLYTYLGGSLRPITSAASVNLATDANGQATKFQLSNSSLSATLLGVAAGERDSLIEWARGKDMDDEFDDISDPSDSRKHIGDVLHSTPISLSYEDSEGGSLLFFGTNEGFLHAINANDGTEEYAFIPKELLGNLKLFRENSRDDPHPYGLDGSITVHHPDKANVTDSDKDGDGVINNGEAARLYVGMRRGGRDYYAFDVSSRSQPRLDWQIKGGVGDFAALGQSWSKPVAARIRYQGEVNNVLIFGGGYDENQDPTNESNLTQKQSTDGVGNAIYIVDAASGTLMWKADGNSFSDMDYSIPSDIRVLDINSDGLADRLYVGDMGGQVWRFDINSQHKAGDNANTLVYGGVMAKLGGNDTIDNARRFYNAPDVALINQEGEQFMSVSIGSGWRAHPRNSSVNDRFYMIRDNRPLEKIMNSNNFGAVDKQTTTPSWRPTTEADLRDVTLAIDTQPTPDQEGWMLRFDEASGEKSLSGSITINNQLVFASYTPEVHRNDCLPASDSTDVYAVDVVRGNPVLPLSEGATITIQDRKEDIDVDGIPPAPTAVIKQNADGSYSTGVLLGTRSIVPELDFSNLTKRTYWHDKLRGRSKPEDIEEQTCIRASANAVEASGGSAAASEGGINNGCT